jgi:uncharacterized protein DUF3352
LRVTPGFRSTRPQQRYGERRTRTADTTIFSRVLYQLSYLAGTGIVSAGRLRASVAWRAMRKLSLLTLIFGTLAIAGCGGSGGGSDGSSPLDNALRYLPADSPFAVAIDTDTKGDQFEAAGDLSDRFALGDEVEKQIKDALGERAGNLEDIQKALGNEFVVGSTDVRSFVDSSGDDTAFVGAIQVDDNDALDKLIDGEKAEEDGEADGAKLYKDDSGDSFAIDGDVLVVAGSKQELEDALATRNGDDGMTESDFDAGTEGVSQDALLRVYLNVGDLLKADPDAKQALKSKWVAAVRTAGIALTFGPQEVAVDIDVTTDPDGLTDADLPIAAGADAPQVLDRGGINLALRDPSQLIEFAQATAGTIDPEGFASFEEDKAKIERELGIDLDKDLIDQLDGDLALSIGLDGKFGARAELKDPAAFEQSLTKLEQVVPNIAEGATGEKVGFVKPKAGEDFYAIATASGDQIVFGVVDEVFVLSNSAAIAGSLAKVGTKAVPGAKGALVLNMNAEQIAREALKQVESTDIDFGDQIEKLQKGKLDAGPLDELVGSFEATTEGLSGSFTVTIDDARK